jgi:hypothetical protein
MLAQASRLLTCKVRNLGILAKSFLFELRTLGLCYVVFRYRVSGTIDMSSHGSKQFSMNRIMVLMRTGLTEFGWLFGCGLLGSPEPLQHASLSTCPHPGPHTKLQHPWQRAEEAEPRAEKVTGWNNST